jgi:branched-chain amino acid transport system permease protein
MTAATSEALPQLRPPAWTFAPRAFLPLLIGIALSLLLQFVVQPAIGGFRSNLMLFTGINIILAVSLTIVNGFAGQFSIGHAGFMALGGYTAAAIMYYGSFRIYGDARFHGSVLSGGAHAPLLASGDMLFIAACIAGGVVAAIAGYVVGLPSLRLRGDYLAIVTLGFGEIVRVILQGTDTQLMRAAEVNATPMPKLMTKLGGALGFIFLPTYTTNFWVWTWVAIMLIVAVRLKYSSYGRALLSIREDEIAAQAVGINVTRYKVRAFILSAFFAGVAGALYAMQVGSINAGDLAFVRSFEIVIMVVLGGLGSVSGAVLAAIILTALPELLRDPPPLWPWGLVTAVVIAAAILLLARRRVLGLIVLLATCVVYEVGIRSAPRFGINLAEYRMIIYALLLIIMMIVRPQGLFGVLEAWNLFRQRRARVIA